MFSRSEPAANQVWPAFVRSRRKVNPEEEITGEADQLVRFEQTFSVNAVIQYTPTDGLLHQNHSFGGVGFVLELRFEQDTDVISLRHTDEFSNVTCGNKLAAEAATEGCSPGLQVADELRLGARHAEVLRFPFECVGVIAVIQQS